MDQRDQTLVGRLALAQGDVAKAQEFVESLKATDTDIYEAALSWSESGQMPNSPEIAGHTPVSLETGRTPTEVFSLLRYLRQDPKGAEQTIRRAPDVGHPPR